MSDYFLYLSVKNTRKISRAFFIKNVFKNFINSIKSSFNQITINSILKYIHIEKPKSSLCKKELVYLNILKLNQGNSEEDSSSKNNNFIYNEMKNYSLDGVYPNLRLLELSNDICIQATNNKIFKNFKNRFWCYYNFYNSSLCDNNKIFINNIGNIGFFLQGSKNFDDNIEIKLYKLKETEKIVLLAYTKKKVYKNDILISNKKLTKI